VGALRPTVRHTREAWYRRPGGPWDGPTLDELLSAGGGSAVDGSARFDAAELEAQVAAVAGGLRAAGVRRRDAVAWQFPNGIDALVLYRACWRLGAVAAPVHHLAGAAEADAFVADVAPRLVVEERDVARLAGRDEAIPANASPAQGADLAVALLTSGSSGEPKGVLHTQRGLAHKARLMAAVHGLRGSDVVLMPAPLAHISGLLNGVLVPGAAGMRSVLMAKWEPDAALDLIAAEGVSFMIGPPTFFVGLLGAGGFSPAAVRSLRLVSSGGAGVTPAFVTTAAEALACAVKRTYGSTEAPTVTTTHAGDDPARGRDTDGRPTGDVEVKLGPGDELLVRGPELFVGYRDAATNADAWARGGWFRTGDVATIDDGGWVTIVGRLKDVIIRGGENIAVAEVEALLEAHPAVRQAVVVGEPDARLGERVAAFVVLAPGTADTAFDLDACRAWFGARGVTRFKTPERVVVVDQLPVLAAGKPDRAVLRARLTESMSRSPV
jgi:cyclohexanecarboxylate-CoA ligase